MADRRRAIIKPDGVQRRFVGETPGVSLRAGLVYGVRLAEDTRRRIELFFSKDEVFQYKMADDPWLFDHGDPL